MSRPDPVPNRIRFTRSGKHLKRYPKLYAQYIDMLKNYRDTIQSAKQNIADTLKSKRAHEFAMQDINRRVVPGLYSLYQTLRQQAARPEEFPNAHHDLQSYHRLASLIASAQYDIDAQKHILKQNEIIYNNTRNHIYDVWIEEINKSGRRPVLISAIPQSKLKQQVDDLRTTKQPKAD